MEGYFEICVIYLDASHASIPDINNITHVIWGNDLVLDSEFIIVWPADHPYALFSIQVFKQPAWDIVSTQSRCSFLHRFDCWFVSWWYFILWKYRSILMLAFQGVWNNSTSHTSKSWHLSLDAHSRQTGHQMSDQGKIRLGPWQDMVSICNYLIISTFLYRGLVVCIEQRTGMKPVS